jgi:hypothetical protein
MEGGVAGMACAGCFLKKEGKHSFFLVADVALYP